MSLSQAGLPARARNRVVECTVIRSSTIAGCLRTGQIWRAMTASLEDSWTRGPGAGNPSWIDRDIELPGRGRTSIREVRGPEGAPTLILLHGLAATGRLNWFAALRALAERFRVIVVDHRGHGRGIRTHHFRVADCDRRYGELPRDRQLAVYCQVGQRGYYAVRFLLQHGYRAANLSGGWATYQALRAAGMMAATIG